MIKLFSQELKTPIGTLEIVGSSSGLCQISFPNRPSECRSVWLERYFSQLSKKRKTPFLNQALEQLREYFEGQRQCFQLQLDLKGTPFQIRVWEQLLDIPYGCTVSYGEIASRINKSQASQAVGAAVGNNPIPIVVPCHRVLGHDGSLVGFSGGLPVKERLLKLEGAQFL